MIDGGLGHVMIYTELPLMLELIPFVPRKWTRLSLQSASPSS